MEYTLGGETYPIYLSKTGVLILVLMEYTLGALKTNYQNGRGKVLILVVMEYTLGGLFKHISPELFVNES